MAFVCAEQKQEMQVPDHSYINGWENIAKDNGDCVIVCVLALIIRVIKFSCRLAFQNVWCNDGWCVGEQIDGWMAG